MHFLFVHPAFFNSADLWGSSKKKGSGRMNYRELMTYPEENPGFEDHIDVAFRETNDYNDHYGHMEGGDHEHAYLDGCRSQGEIQ
jgi:hypothetical protein